MMCFCHSYKEDYFCVVYKFRKYIMYYLWYLYTMLRYSTFDMTVVVCSRDFAK